jgi:hypothetical protein
MADKKQPAGFKAARQAGDDDVEGHRHTAREGIHTAREGIHTAREGFSKSREAGAEDDVEGHSMLPNSGLTRPLAQARERDIQQHLKRHDFEADARAAKKDHR